MNKIRTFISIFLDDADIIHRSLTLELSIKLKLYSSSHTNMAGTDPIKVLRFSHPALPSLSKEKIDKIIRYFKEHYGGGPIANYDFSRNEGSLCIQFDDESGKKRSSARL